MESVIDNRIRNLKQYAQKWICGSVNSAFLIHPDRDTGNNVAESVALVIFQGDLQLRLGVFFYFVLYVVSHNGMSLPENHPNVNSYLFTE